MITNLRMELFQALLLVQPPGRVPAAPGGQAPVRDCRQRDGGRGELNLLKLLSLLSSALIARFSPASVTSV